MGTRLSDVPSLRCIRRYLLQEGYVSWRTNGSINQYQSSSSILSLYIFPHLGSPLRRSRTIHTLILVSGIAHIQRLRFRLPLERRHDKVNRWTHELWPPVFKMRIEIGRFPTHQISRITILECVLTEGAGEVATCAGCWVSLVESKTRKVWEGKKWSYGLRT